MAKEALDVRGGYWAHIQDAKVRTERFGLPTPRPTLQTDRRWLVPENREAVQRALQVGMQIGSYGDIVGECVAVHHRAQAVLAQTLGCEVLYTIGWIDDSDGGPRFYFDDNDVERWLSDEGPRDGLNMHTWLTLPSMEIIDIVLGTSVAARSGDHRYKGRILVGHADQLPLKYRPMLLGDGLVVEMGLV